MADQYNYATSAAVADMDEGLRKYMLRVYNYMFLGVAFTGAVSFLVASTPALLNPLLSIVYGSSFGILILLAPIMAIGWFGHKLMMARNPAIGFTTFFLYAGLIGLWVAPMFVIYNIESVVKVFFMTAAIFGAMSLFGYTTKRDLRPMGKFLGMMAFGLFLIVMANILLPMIGITLFEIGGWFHTVLAIAIIAVYSGLTAYTTQEIKEWYADAFLQGNSDQVAVFGAFILYGYFVTIFMWMMTLFGNQE